MARSYRNSLRTVADGPTIPRRASFRASDPSCSSKLSLRIVAKVLTLVLLLHASPTDSQTLRQQIVGTWSAVSQYVDQDGKRLEPFGANPKGMVMYAGDGHFMLVLQRSTLPKFGSNNRLKGTPEENAAIVQGSIAYFGTYTVDERQNAIKLHYDGSTYPNWDGDDQTRLVEIVGDELKMTSPVSAVGGGSVHLLLRRVHQ